MGRVDHSLTINDEDTRYYGRRAACLGDQSLSPLVEVNTNECARIDSRGGVAVANPAGVDELPS